MIMTKQLTHDVISESDVRKAERARRKNRKFSRLNKHPPDSSSSGLEYDR